jgi:hypothetical protein
MKSLTPAPPRSFSQNVRIHTHTHTHTHKYTHKHTHILTHARAYTNAHTETDKREYIAQLIVISVLHMDGHEPEKC